MGRLDWLKKKIVFSSKGIWIGKVMKDKHGKGHLVVGILEEGFETIRMDELLEKTKDKNLEDVLKKYLPPEKIKRAIIEIELYRRKQK